MAKKIVSTGRGGAGKSSFAALVSRYLKPPTLLIDLDPDPSLADMLGFDLAKEGKRTVCEALYDVVERRKRNISPTITTHEQMESLLWSDCLFEGKMIDLIALGTKLTEGCLCAPDEILRRAIPKLAKSYTNLVIDSPAGVEHLNRNIVSEINDIFVICDPSDKSLKHIGRIKKIIRQVGIKYGHFYLVANHECTEETEKYLQDTGETYLGKMDFDARLEQHNLEGKSLLELSEDSAACLSVRRILEKAGYQTRA